MGVVNGPASEPHYTTTFHNYIIWGISYLRQMTGGDGPTVIPEMQSQILHLLGYALNPANQAAIDGWPATYALIVQMTPEMEKRGYWDTWIPYVVRALCFSQSMGDSVATGELNLQLGLLYQAGGQLARASTSLQAAASAFAQIQDVVKQANALNRLAYIARLQRDYERAVKLVEAALILVDEESFAREFSYFVLGTIALDKEDWPSAVDNFRRSLTICSQHNERHKLAKRHGDLGIALRRQHQYQAAITHYEQAIVMLGELQNKVQQAIVRMNLGNVYLDLNRAEQAHQLYRAAEPILFDAHDELHLAMLYTNVGIACRMLQWWEEGVEVFHKAIAIWQRGGNLVNLVNTLDELGLLYVEEHAYEQAYVTLRQAQQLLTEIRDDPSYHTLNTSVSDHLAQVVARR